MRPLQGCKSVLEKVPMMKVDPMDVFPALLVQVKVDQEGEEILCILTRTVHQRPWTHLEKNTELEHKEKIVRNAMAIK